MPVRRTEKGLKLGDQGQDHRESTYCIKVYGLSALLFYLTY